MPANCMFCSTVHGKNISSSAKDNTSPALTLTPTIPVACDEFDITVDNVHEGKEEEFTVVISSTDPSDRVSTNNSTAVITVHRNAHKTFYGDVVGFRLWVCQIGTSMSRYYITGRVTVFDTCMSLAGRMSISRLSGT